jgi:hypothetical protein
MPVRPVRSHDGLVDMMSPTKVAPELFGRLKVAETSQKSVPEFVNV